MNRTRTKPNAKQGIGLRMSPEAKCSTFLSIHAKTPKPNLLPPKRSKSPVKLNSPEHRFTRGGGERPGKKDSVSGSKYPKKERVTKRRPKKPTNVVQVSLENSLERVKRTGEPKSFARFGHSRREAQRGRSLRESSHKRGVQFRRGKEGSPSQGDKKEYLVSKIHTIFEEKKAGIEKKFGIKPKKRKKRAELEKFKGKFDVEFRSMDKEKGRRAHWRGAGQQAWRQVKRGTFQKLRETSLAKKSRIDKKITHIKSFRTKSFKVKQGKENQNRANRREHKKRAGKATESRKTKHRHRKQRGNTLGMVERIYAKGSRDLGGIGRAKGSLDLKKKVKCYSRESMQGKWFLQMGVKFRKQMKSRITRQTKQAHQRRQHKKRNTLKTEAENMENGVAQAWRKQKRPKGEFSRSYQGQVARKVEASDIFKLLKNLTKTNTKEVDEEPNHSEKDYIDLNQMGERHSADVHSSPHKSTSFESRQSPSSAEKSSGKSDMKSEIIQTPKTRNIGTLGLSRDSPRNQLNQNAVRRKKKRKAIYKSKSLSEFNSAKNQSDSFHKPENEADVNYFAKKPPKQYKLFVENELGRKLLEWQESLGRERSSEGKKRPQAKSKNIEFKKRISQNSKISKNNVNNTTFFRCNINIFSTMDAFYQQRKSKSYKTSDSNCLAKRSDARKNTFPMPRKTIRPRQSKSLNSQKPMRHPVIKKKERYAVKCKRVDMPILELEEDEFVLEKHQKDPYIVAEKSNFKNTFSSSSSLKIGVLDIQNEKQSSHPEAPRQNRPDLSEGIQLESPCIETGPKLHIPIPPKPKQSIINVDDIISEKSPSPTIQKESVSRYDLMGPIDANKATVDKVPQRAQSGESPADRDRQRNPDPATRAALKQPFPSSPTYPQLLLHPIPTPLIFSHRLAQDLLDSLKLSYSTPKNMKPVFVTKPDDEDNQQIVFINSNSKSKNVPLEKYLNSISKCFKNMNFISNVDNIHSIEQVKQSIANMDMGQISKDLGDFRLLLTKNANATISGRLKDTFDRLDRLSKTASNLKPPLRKSSGDYKVHVHNEPSTSDVKIRRRKRVVAGPGEIYDSCERCGLMATSSEKYRSEEDIVVDFSDNNLRQTRDSKESKSKREITTGVFQIFQQSELEKDLLSDKKNAILGELGTTLFPKQEQTDSARRTDRLSFTVSNQKIIPQMGSFSQNGGEPRAEAGHAGNSLSNQSRRVQINSFKDGERTSGVVTPRQQRRSLMDMVNQVNILGSEIFKKKSKSDNKHQLVSYDDAEAEASGEVNLECNEIIFPKRPEVIEETTEPDFSTNQNKSSESATDLKKADNPSGMRPARPPSKEPRPQIPKNVFYDQSIISKATTFSEKENALLSRIKLDESKSNDRQHLLTRKRLKGTLRTKPSFFKSPKHSLNPMMQFRKIKENCLSKCDLFLKKNKIRRNENRGSFANKQERPRKKSEHTEFLFSGKAPTTQQAAPGLSIEKSKGRGQQLSQTISDNSEHYKIQSLADNLHSHKKKSKYNFYSNYQNGKQGVKSRLRKSPPRGRVDQGETDKAPEPHIFSIDMTSKSSKQFSFKPKMSVPGNSSHAKDLCIYERKHRKRESQVSDIYFTNKNFFRKKRRKGGAQAVASFKNYSRKRPALPIANFVNFDSQKSSPRNCLNIESFSGPSPPMYLNPKFKKLNFSDQRMTLNENNNYTFCENEFKQNADRKMSDVAERYGHSFGEQRAEESQMSRQGDLKMRQDNFQSFSNDVKEKNDDQQRSSKNLNEYSSEFSNYIEFKSKQRGCRKPGKRKGPKTRSDQLFAHKGSISRQSRQKNMKKLKRYTRAHRKLKSGINQGSIRNLFREKYSLRKMKSLEKV